MQETPSCRTTPEHPLRHTCSFAWISLLRFARSIKGKVNSKYVSGDWKERGCSLCFPAQVMLRGSWVFALGRSILFL